MIHKRDSTSSIAICISSGVPDERFDVRHLNQIRLDIGEVGDRCQRQEEVDLSLKLWPYWQQYKHWCRAQWVPDVWQWTCNVNLVLGTESWLEGLIGSVHGSEWPILTSTCALEDMVDNSRYVINSELCDGVVPVASIYMHVLGN